MNQQQKDYRTVPTHRGFYVLFILTVIGLAFCTSGCSTMSTYERTWQTMHLIDYGQTLHIARSPSCFREVNFMTKRLVGEHPSESEVALVTAGYALAHYGINRWLEAKAETTGGRGWHGVLRFFQATTLLSKLHTVARNHSLGLRPFADGDTCVPEPSYDPSARPVK